ncbi:MAG: HAD family hydrolase [Elusimicrobiota bacterium]
MSLYLKPKQMTSYPINFQEGRTLALRAIIFDCDGVLVDSEPLHFSALKKTLEEAGYLLTEEIYKERYLANDDKGAFTHFYEDNKYPLTPENLAILMQKKAKHFEELVSSEGILPYPAVPEFVMAVSQRYPLAIASGARKHELEIITETAGIRSYFESIISADDVEKGKPDPESYIKALYALNNNGKRNSAIRPEECVVIEDSKEGIKSAHNAGMKCVAVATSYPAFELAAADLIVPSISALRISQMEDLFQPPAPLPMTSQKN